MREALPLKVALCDDDKIDREFFYDLCKEIKDSQNLVMKLKEYKSGDALLYDFANPNVAATVDIILLDIKMPGTNGMEVAKKLREQAYHGTIIFITNSDKHWREAFDIKALNYITKDKEVEMRFKKTFLEAVQEAKERRGRTLLFSSLQETRKVEVARISHFEIKNYLVCVYYDQETFEFISTLAKIEQLLFGNENFVRVNRSCLLSVAHIKQFEKEKNKVIMQNGAVIPVSTRRVKDLTNALANSMN